MEKIEKKDEGQGKAERLEPWPDRPDMPRPKPTMSQSANISSRTSHKPTLEEQMRESKTELSDL